MFLDLRDLPPPEPWRPVPPPTDPRRERAIMRAVGLLLLAVTIAPFGGAGLIELVLHLLGR